MVHVASSAGNPLFPLDAARLKGVQIFWPKRYAWPEAEKWVGSTMQEMRRFVTVKAEDIGHTNEELVELHLICDGETYPVVIDFTDYSDHIDAECLGRAIRYFKMQYRQGGYGSERVVPGGYVNVSPRILNYLPSLRRVRRKGPEAFDVYGRFGLRFGGELRTRVVSTLSDQKSFRYEGGLKLLRYSRYLKEVARARFALICRGMAIFVTDLWITSPSALVSWLVAIIPHYRCR